MKTESIIGAVALALLVVQINVQAAGHSPSMEYKDPFAYPSRVAYPPQTAYPQQWVPPVSYKSTPHQWAQLASYNAPQPVATDEAGLEPLDTDDSTVSLPESAGCDDSGCSKCGSRRCCCPRWAVFGELLYLRPRNAEVVYAVPIDDGDVPPGPNPVQVGPTAIADFDYEPGFRVGLNGRLGDCGSIGVTYTFFEAATSGNVEIVPGSVMHSMVSHPGSDSATHRFLSAEAEYSMDFDLVDVDFHRVFSCGRRHQLSCLLGARYGALDQDFIGRMAINQSEVVTTNLGFDGGGIRVGLEAEWYGPKRAWMAYGRGAASFVAGEFRGVYTQDHLFGQRVVYTDWRAGRIVTMLDLELGVGWTSPKGCFHLAGGYMVSGWFNAVTTADFINAVQANEFAGLGDSLTFDGFVARAEIRF